MELLVSAKLAPKTSVFRGSRSYRWRCPRQAEFLNAGYVCEVARARPCQERRPSWVGGIAEGMVRTVCFSSEPGFLGGEKLMDMFSYSYAGISGAKWTPKMSRHAYNCF